MLSNEEFVRHSIDLHLFFMRIMKEHMFFIEVSFTPKDKNLSSQAATLKREAEAILEETVSIADGFVSPMAVVSGEFLTQFTMQAEEATEFFTGIPFDTALTEREKGLASGNAMTVNSAMMQRVQQLNQRAIRLVTDIIKYKEALLNNVLTCKIFTVNYPLLIDHILREARFYLNKIMRLQSRDVILSASLLAEEEAFWNRIMAEHAKFIRGLLDPTENDLFNKANQFGNTFDQLTAESRRAQENMELLPGITRKSLAATADIRSFKKQGTEGILECKIKSIIIPLLGDHTLREANHFLHVLATGARNRVGGGG